MKAGLPESELMDSSLRTEVYKEIAMSQLSEEELKNAGKEEN